MLDHAERFNCCQLPIYANSYVHVSLKLPSITFICHNSLLYINSYKIIPHKLSLIFHHFMFISFHTMLLYIDFWLALFTDIPVLSSHLESPDTFLFYLPSPRVTPCFVFPVFLIYPIFLFYFFEFGIAYIKGHIEMQYYFFFVLEMSLAATTFLSM